MKAFYYKKDVGPRSRMYGHRKVKLIVYGVNRGTLEKNRGGFLYNRSHLWRFWRSMAHFKSCRPCS